MVEFYRVGGCVRDAVLGRKCKDIDFSVEAESYDEMRQEVLDRGGEIFVENPEFFTIRAKVMPFGSCDFVLCRKDGQYTDGRRPDQVIQGTIYDDLARRDFTMNAMAEDLEGNILDPHDGLNDIQKQVIRCVGSPEDRFREDSLRILRALRFAVTLHFELAPSVEGCLRNFDIVKQLQNVSVERVREELFKAFKADTLRTLDFLEKFDLVKVVLFLKNKDGLWLMPTLKQ